MTKKARKGLTAPSRTGIQFSRRDAAEMVKHQITHIPIDSFHYREFRYSNLKDAIAQAKRHEQKN